MLEKSGYLVIRTGKHINSHNIGSVIESIKSSSTSNLCTETLTDSVSSKLTTSSNKSQNNDSFAIQYRKNLPKPNNNDAQESSLSKDPIKDYFINVRYM